jgi:hypothetical protein
LSLLLPTPTIPSMNNNIVPLRANSLLKKIRTCTKAPKHSKDITKLSSLAVEVTTIGRRWWRFPSPKLWNTDHFEISYSHSDVAEN